MKDSKKIDHIFFSQGIYGCVSYPRIQCNGKFKFDPKREISKVVVNDHFARNELAIGKRIHEMKSSDKTIPEYRFVYYHRSCNIDRNKLKENNKLYRSCNLFHKKREKSSFIILYGTFIDSFNLKEKLVLKYSSNLLLHVYWFGLGSIHNLINTKIIHNDIKSNNILVHRKDQRVFSLIDFGMSIDMKRAFTKNGYFNKVYLKPLFVYDPTFPLWSIEHHILSFYFKNDRVVSLEELDEFIDKSLSKKLHIYRKEDVKNYLVSFLYEKDSFNVMKNLFKSSWKTWDLYSLAYNTLLESYVHKDKNHNSFIDLLYKSLHYDYKQRPPIELIFENFKEALRGLRV